MVVTMLIKRLIMVNEISGWWFGTLGMGALSICLFLFKVNTKMLDSKAPKLLSEVPYGHVVFFLECFI